MMKKPYFLIPDNPGYAGLATTVYSRHDDFCNEISGLLRNENNHCINYYSIEKQGFVELICCIADDTKNTLGFTFLTFFRETPLIHGSTFPQMHI